MKKQALFFAVSILLVSNSQAIHILNALKQNLIKAEVLWKSPEDMQSTSSRHGENLRISLSNLKNTQLEVEVPAGSMFIPENDEHQNMLITKSMLFVLQPNGQLVKYAHGYCCEASDGAPSKGEYFSLSKKVDEKLSRLAKLLDTDSIEGYGVQRAVWCLSDNKNLEQINTNDSAGTAKLIRYTGTLAGYPNSVIDSAIVHALRSNHKIFERMVPIEFKLSADSYVWIFVHDINNNTVKHVVQKAPYNKGIHNKTVGVSSIDIGGGEFKIRVYSSEGFVAEKAFRVES